MKPIQKKNAAGFRKAKAQDSTTGAYSIPKRIVRKFRCGIRQQQLVGYGRSTIITRVRQNKIVQSDDCHRQERRDTFIVGGRPHTSSNGRFDRR